MELILPRNCATVTFWEITCLHSHVGKPQSDGKRLAGSGLLLLGSTMLALSLLIMGTLQWGWPSACQHASASTPLCTCRADYWAVGVQTRIRYLGGLVASAAQGDSHGGVAAPRPFRQATVVNAPRPQSPPAWIMSIALLALLSWCFAARRRGSWR